MIYIVELEQNTWIAPWEGDPGRTSVIENSKVFPTKRTAEAGLKAARKYCQFRFAKIIPLTVEFKK